MELVLTIIAVVGGLLFIFSYLKFVLSGFRYHPITGLLAFIPVVNLITLPTLMDDKLVRTILIGVLGLILAVGSWFLGADKSLQKHISSLRGQPTIISSSKQELMGKTKEPTLEADTSTTSKTIEASAGTSQAVPQSVYFEDLPKRALYSMEFIEAPVQQINTLEGRVVRITSNSGTVSEGEIQKVEKGSVFISKNGEGNIAYETLIANIKQLLVMVRRK